MSSAAKSIGEEVENVQASGSKARVSYHTFERGIFRYGLAVLLRRPRVGNKASSPAIAFSDIRSALLSWPPSRSHFLTRERGRVFSLLCSRALAFGFFVLPYQVDYRIVLADGSTKPVYASREWPFAPPLFLLLRTGSAGNELVQLIATPSRAVAQPGT